MHVFEPRKAKTHEQTAILRCFRHRSTLSSQGMGLWPIPRHLTKVRTLFRAPSTSFPLPFGPTRCPRVVSGGFFRLHHAADGWVVIPITTATPTDRSRGCPAPVVACVMGHTCPHFVFGVGCWAGSDRANIRYSFAARLLYDGA